LVGLISAKSFLALVVARYYLLNFLTYSIAAVLALPCISCGAAKKRRGSQHMNESHIERKRLETGMLHSALEIHHL